MNLEKRFNELHSFLEEHIELINYEPLEHYEIQLPLYKRWVEIISTLSEDQKISFTNSSQIHFPIDSLNQFLERVDQLLSLNEISQKLAEIHVRYLQNINKKKRYEVKRILCHKEIENAESYIDIGSGAGHLSTCLLINNSKKSLCLDANIDYQKIGKEKLKKIDPEMLNRLSFKEEFVGPQTNLPISKNSIILGLHACGNLTVDIMNLYLKSNQKTLISFGCCYHKLTEDHLYLSLSAQKKKCFLTNSALTMAAKIKPESKKSFKKKVLVKNYRYALHLYLSEKYQKEFIPLGNAAKDDYNLEFSQYAKKYVELLKAESEEELNQFYQLKSTKLFINNILSLGLIRAKLGKLIELYINLDRALYLAENGCEVEIEAYFDEEISPRNYLLFSKKK